jgi:hypothetical protein
MKAVQTMLSLFTSTLFTAAGVAAIWSIATSVPARPLTPRPSKGDTQ